MRTPTQSVYTFYLPTKIVHGAGSVQETGKEFMALGAKRCLVVTDKGVRRAGLIDAVLESLEKSGVFQVVFDNVEEDPNEYTVTEGAKVALEHGCDGIVVVGGGSPICAGRGIGIVVSNGGEIRDFVGLNKAAKPPLPLVAIPTTAGSGAEVSQFIVLKDKGRDRKIVLGSPLYFPKVAILDPNLVISLPPWQLTVSGIDALSHAIEAYLTTTSTFITDSLALTAGNLIYTNLRAAVTSDDVDAKEACLIGSSMANMACGNTKLGLVHAMTAPMESMFKIAHGVAVGTMLPYVLEFNLPASHKRFSMLAKNVVGVKTEKSLEDLGLLAVTGIKKLYLDLGFPRKYSESEIDKKAIPQMAKMVMGGLYNVFDAKQEYPMNSIVPSVNIRKATMKDVINLYERSFEGW